MASNKSMLRVSLALVPSNSPPGSQARQDDLIPRMLEFTTADQRFAVGRSSSGKSPIPSLFNALFHSRSVSRQHAELSIDPRTNLLMVEDLRSMHGTYLNSTKLASGITHYVHSGDVLQFGSDIQHEERGHFAPRTFKVSYGPAPPAMKHTVPIQARRPGSFQVPDTTTDEEEEEDSEVEVLETTDTSFDNSPLKTTSVHHVEVVSDSEDEIQVLSVTKRTPAGVALKDLFTDDDDECSSPLRLYVPATSTSQVTIEHPTTGIMEPLPSQDRMRISNILSMPADNPEVVAQSESQASTAGPDMLESDFPVAEPKRELSPESEDEEQDATTATKSEVGASNNASLLVEPENKVEPLPVRRLAEDVWNQLSRSDSEQVPQPDEGGATADIQVPNDVPASADSMLADALIATRTKIDASFDDARKAQESRNVRKLLEPLAGSPPDVKAYLAWVEESENALAAELSSLGKRQRDDAVIVASTDTQPQAEHVHKRPRHDAHVARKHDRRPAEAVTWQATIKPFMLGALVGGMGVFGGLLSMADMQ